MCIHKHLSSQRIPKHFLKSAQQSGQDSPGCWAQVKLCKTSEDSAPTGCLWAGKEQPVSQTMEISGTRLKETLSVSVEMPVLKQPAWQEWHFLLSNSYGNRASKPYPLLNHIWILPTAPELIPNNNTSTPQMHIPLTESLVITFH